MRLRLVCLLLFVFAGPALAQAVLEEASVGPAFFGDNARRIEVRDMNGDGRRDLLLVRRGPDGERLELWLRDDPGSLSYRLSEPLALLQNVVDAVVFDFDVDGDNDIVVAVAAAEASPGGVILLSREGGASFYPSYSRGPLLPLPSITSLKVQDVETAGGLRFGVAAITGDARVQLYAVVPGSGLQPVQALPHAGGVVTSIAVPFLLEGGSAVLTLGAAPQRLWVWNGSAYTERAVSGMGRTVRRATSVTVDGDDALDLVTADSEGRVEVWKGTALGANQPADRFDLVQQLEAAGNPVVALDTAVIDPGTIDVLVGRQQAQRPFATGLHRITIASGSIAPRAVVQTGGSGIGIDRSSPNTVFLASPSEPLRAFVRPGTATPGTLGFARTDGYYTLENLNTIIRLTSPPLPQNATLSLLGALGAVEMASFAGTRIHDLLVSRTPFTATPGKYTFTLQDPQIPGIVRREPLQTVLTVFERPNGSLNGLCSVECLMLGCIGIAGGKSAGESNGIGTLAQVQLLRDFRDDVLLTSPKGREYVEIYDEFEVELYVRSFASPIFLSSLREAKDAWMPAIESMVSGSGTATITPAMLDHMDAVFGHFRSNGSERLRQLIERRYMELDPRQFENQPIAAMQTYWEEVLLPERILRDGFESPPPP